MIKHDVKCLLILLLEPIYSEYFGNYMYINEAGTTLLFDTDQALPGLPKGDDVGHFVGWDIQNSTLQKDFFISILYKLMFISVIVVKVS